MKSLCQEFVDAAMMTPEERLKVFVEAHKYGFPMHRILPADLYEAVKGGEETYRKWWKKANKRG